MTKKQRAEMIFKNIFECANVEFFQTKNKKFNIAKIARVSGLSPKFVRTKLAQKGLR